MKAKEYVRQLFLIMFVFIVTIFSTIYFFNDKFDNNALVNIAVSSGDALMIEDLINKYPEKFKDSTLIISISQNQLNDNSKQLGYFSFNMISFNCITRFF